jgi:hypothetical protein
VTGASEKDSRLLVYGLTGFRIPRIPAICAVHSPRRGFIPSMAFATWAVIARTVITRLAVSIIIVTVVANCTPRRRFSGAATSAFRT